MNEINDFYTALKVEPEQIKKFFSKKDSHLFKRLQEKISRILHFIQHHVWINKENVINALHQNKVKNPAILKDFEQTPIYRKVMRVVYGYDLPKPSAKQQAHDVALFFKNFIQHPKQTGSFVPSSKNLAKQIVSCIPKGIDATEERWILEVGPGLGPFSNAIISKLGPNDKLHLVEFNPKFVNVLNERYSHLYPRVQVIQEDILNYDPGQEYDYIISGLPLNSFSKEFVQSVFDKFDELIKRGGKLSYFEYSYLSQIRMGVMKAEDKKNLKEILKIKEAYYKKNPLKVISVPLNVTPAKVIIHQKV